jgi:peroxisomal membrane protein 2
MWARYANAVRTAPLATKSLSSLIITAAGDVGCQLLVERRETVDSQRCAKMAVVGGVLVGPSLHFWYGTLLRLVPGGSLRDVAKRVALDQLVFAPPFTAACFGFISALDMRGIAALKAQLRQQWSDAVIANWKLWTPAQCVNFYAVPAQYHVLFANVVALGWNVYLSWATHLEVR